MNRATLLVLCLAGCVNALPVGAERPPRESDLAVIDAVSAAWRTAGNPWTAQCRQERRDRLVVVRATQDVMASTGFCASRGPCCGSAEKQRACGCDRAYGCAAGTVTREADWVQPLAGATQHWRVMLWISAYEDEQTQHRLIAHEWTHALGACSLRDDDRMHTAHPEWWGSDGIESAAW